MLSRLYRKSGNLGSEGTPNAVWLTSDPAGQFFLVSYLNGPRVRASWIEPGALIPLPARLGVNATSVA